VVVTAGKSVVRSRLEVPFDGARYGDTFLMSDFVDTSDFGADAHLFFTRLGSVESFPLPGGIRRWVVQTPEFMKGDTGTFLEDRVFERTGIRLDREQKVSESPFGVQHYMSRHWYSARTFLSGDAAHIMSPIGGQGMNTGFADAEYLAALVTCLYRDCSDVEKLKRAFEKHRKKAAAAATKRAKLSMTIGTMKGRVSSALRNLLIKVLLATSVGSLLPPYFSMLTIPYGSLEKAGRKNRLLREYYQFEHPEKKAL
jgi:2-polyprenyl-6-methoxyphenol hydroxylase-like FAD-dependent oxidoreductase